MTPDNLLPHQMRVIDERRDLGEKIDKLRSFLASEHTGPSATEAALLRVQLEIMRAYSAVLTQRIESWPKEDAKSEKGHVYLRTTREVLDALLTEAEKKRISSVDRTSDMLYDVRSMVSELLGRACQRTVRVVNVTRAIPAPSMDDPLRQNTIYWISAEVPIGTIWPGGITPTELADL